jgi:NAD(P)-dependent dehydrogenase (short-subunit alcohol dehydrogenase family)
VTDRELTIITGGSRGIGGHLVRSCLEEMDVLSISRSPTAPPRAAGAGSTGHRLHDLCLDLGDVERIAPALDTWFQRHPGYKVKLFISNAAILSLGWLDRIAPAEVRRAFDVNVHAPLAITAALLGGGHLARTECRIVYVTSSLGRAEPALSFAGLGLYSITKAALCRLALIQQREFELTAPWIRVLRVHPGIVDTDLQRELRRDAALDPAFAQKTAGLPPYEEGDWDGKVPAEHMRTISAELSAEFIRWVARTPDARAEEYDFYTTLEFHAARARARVLALALARKDGALP